MTQTCPLCGVEVSHESDAMAAHIREEQGLTKRQRRDEFPARDLEERDRTGGE